MSQLLLQTIMAGIVFALAGTPAAGETTGGGAAVVRVSDAWARPTPGPVRNGAAYFTVTNVSEQTIRITGVSSPVAGRAELHTHIRDGDIMRMRPVDIVSVPAGSARRFQPGGLHVMLFELIEPLEIGQVFPLVLELAEQEPETIQITVGAEPGRRPN